MATDWSHHFGVPYTLAQTSGKDLAGTTVVLGIKYDLLKPSSKEPP